MAVKSPILTLVGSVLILAGCSLPLEPLPTVISTRTVVDPVKPRVVPLPRPTQKPAPTLTPRAATPPTVEKPPTASSTPEPIATPSIIADISPEPTLSPTRTVVPTPGPRAIVIDRGAATDKVVALTYDAGADRGLSASLLAYLQEAGIKVTFGMTGRWAESNPDLVRRMVADGHELMNHTYDHRSFTGVSANPPVLRLQDRIDEIDRTETIIHNLTGATTKPLFRPPYGDEDASVLQAVAAAGYRYSVLWTVDSLGWRGYSVTDIVDRCLRLAQPGAIYVLHVGAGSHDIEATRSIVEGLRARGYGFVTVGQLIGASGR